MAAREIFIGKGVAYMERMWILKKKDLSDKEKKYRMLLWSLLACAVSLLVCVSYLACWKKVPGRIHIRAGQQEQIDFGIPASGNLHGNEVESIPVSLDQPVTFFANEIDSYEMDVRLFGVVPLKKVDVHVIEDDSIIPAGIPIGIYVKTEGVLVVGTGEFTGYDGRRYAPSEHILCSGDYILRINGTEVTGKKMFMSKLREAGSGEQIFTIRRNGNVFDVKIEAVEDQAGVAKVGIWVRDNAQGVGTLTYVDKNGDFGALGHGINDMDTSTLMDLGKGTLYHTDIIGIRRGEKGHPGELTGVIDYTQENVIGLIDRNTDQGIFGECGQGLLQEVTSEPLKIGLRQEVHPGAAQIMCCIDERGARLYDVEILAINNEVSHKNREIVLKITDEELLHETGGIVQGMSGAPIIQDGRLIGAVTHVMVQDSTRGYGIFIENMLEH